MTHRPGTLGSAIPLTLALGVGLALAAAHAEARAQAAPAGTAVQAALPAPGTYTLDPPHVFVEFVAQHKVVGRVHGRFDRTAGTVIVAAPAATGVDVSIETMSLSTQNTVRDEDVRGPDFFDVAHFPAMTYQGRGLRRTRTGWVLDGTLTIRGVARRVPLAITFRGTAPPQAGQPRRVAFHASAAVRRADFGMTRDLLDEIGRVSNAPDVWIDIDAELLASTPPAGGR